MEGPTAKLTKRTVDAAKPAERDYVLWDDDLPRFGLRVRASGSITYVVQYRAKGRTRHVTLDHHGPLTPDAARRRATPTMGNRIVSLLSTLFRFAERRDLVPPYFNPCRGIERYTGAPPPPLRAARRGGRSTAPRLHRSAAQRDPRAALGARGARAGAAAAPGSKTGAKTIERRDTTCEGFSHEDVSTKEGGSAGGEAPTRGSNLPSRL